MTIKNPNYNKEYYKNNEEYFKEYREKNKEKLKEYFKKWRLKNKDKVKKYNKTPKRKAGSRKYQLKLKYGLTLREYNKLLEKQKGVCAICKNRELNKNFLAVDHNWKTRKVRGLLCKNCNLVLGNSKEDISLFQKCIKYLEEYSKD